MEERLPATTRDSVPVSRAWSVHRASASVPPSALKPEHNPFPGLRPFGAAEAHLFFGRELHIEQLLGKLTTSRFSSVIGVSGSGKSSVVFAGVIPRLLRGYRVAPSNGVPARSCWRIAQMRPGSDPFGNLTAALLKSTNVNDVDDLELSDTPALDALDAQLEQDLLAAQLLRSQNGLVDACRSLSMGSDENLLLIVDQFEELFRFRKLQQGNNSVHDPAAAFVQLLLRACEQTRVPIYVMLTMRSDFLGECVQFTGLPEAINQGQFLLPLLNRDEREQMIRGPLAVAQAPVAAALVQRLLNDAGDMTDQLPVLQHALMRSFDLWRKETVATSQLDLSCYIAAGGVQRALSIHAEEAIEEVRVTFSDAGMRIVEKLFRALTEPGDQGRGVRRPCRVAEVAAVTGADEDTLRRVVDNFARPGRGFIVVQSSADGAFTPESTLDISHEALMRVWQRLQEWTAREFTFANQLRHLNEAEQKHTRGVAGLWREPELGLALSWLAQEQPTPLATERYGVDLSRVRAFLDSSVVAHQAALAVERDAATVRRVRRLLAETKTSTLMALLAIPVLLVLQAIGVLEQALPFEKYIKDALSVSFRYVATERQNDERLRAVVVDDKTKSSWAERERDGEKFGEFGARWRSLHADVLTRLSDAHAKVVVLDIRFGEQEQPTALVSNGTRALANAILHARGQGTAVIIAASHPACIDTTLGRALVESIAGKPDAALGLVANPALGTSGGGAAAVLPLTVSAPGKPHFPTVPLAAMLALEGMPNIVVDADSNSLFLAAQGLQHQFKFAGFAPGANPDACQVDAGAMTSLQLVDVSARGWGRASENVAVIPYESVTNGEPLADLSGNIVVVGTEDAKVTALGCIDSFWSCQFAERPALGLHLDAIDNLLSGRAIRPVSGLVQLVLSLAFCAAVAWARLRNHNQSALRQRLWLAGFVALDVMLASVAAIQFDLLMSEAVHIVAMVVTHYLVGRLGTRRTLMRMTIESN